MPVKRRRSKRPTEDLFAWSPFFEFGYDMLHLLRHLTPEEQAAQAPDAWCRLGARFLDERDLDERFPLPWALTQFGEPPQCR